MSNVTWLIEPHPDFPAAEQLLALLPQAIKLHAQVSGQESWPEVEGPVVAYGTMRTLTRMQRHPTLYRAVFDDYPLLRFSSYSRVVYDLLGRAPMIVPMTALPFLPLKDWFGERAFVRSDSNFKLFASEVLPIDDLRALPQRHAQHKDELVVLCRAVHLGPEFRVFCRDGQVVTHSSYPDSPYRPAPADVLAFAREVAARLLTLGIRCVTVDVAKGDRLRLVEIGGWNSWGLYGADPSGFISAMEAEAEQQYSDTV
jgi:hypothetical protein